MTNLKSTPEHYHFEENGNIIAIPKAQANYDVCKAFSLAIGRLNNIKGRFRSGGNR